MKVSFGILIQRLNIPVLPHLNCYIRYTDTKVHTMLVLWALNQNFAFNSRFSNSFEDLFSRKSAITFGLVDVVVHSEVVGDHFNGRNENHCAIWFQALLQIC